MTSAKRTCSCAIATLAIWTSPAIAGEINGAGTQLPAVQSESLCAYSGLNDLTDESPFERIFGDPGGRVQSYGYGGIQDPEDSDPRTGRGSPIPGFWCNPTLPPPDPE
jgi:hypothetical protein